MSGTPILSAALRVAFYREEDRIRHHRLETAIVFDLQGNELFRRTGDEESVAFPDAELLLMRDALLTHNHPEDHALSLADLQLAIVNDLAGIRAVSPLRRFMLLRPSGGWPDLHDAPRVFSSTYRKFRQRYAIERWLGMSAEEAERRLLDETWHTLVQRLRLLSIVERT